MARTARVTQRGASIPDILAAARRSARRPSAVLHVLEPPSADADAQLRWLADHRDEVNAKLASHGAVNLPGWDLIRTPEGFRAPTRRSACEPCRDPLRRGERAAHGRQGDAVEAVNKESRANSASGCTTSSWARARARGHVRCFKQAEEGGEFMVCDGRRVFRDATRSCWRGLRAADPRSNIRSCPALAGTACRRRSRPAPSRSRSGRARRRRCAALVAAAINAKVDFDVAAVATTPALAYATTRRAARAPVQPPVVLHPATSREPTWFCNVHSTRP